ncbi:MAG: hypothetical protein AUJ82_01825 [Verrucomicrobia bacterium CG1_02_43_26]|nr:MAG: hypothetical protein AUJ82_01825 [Verrucomicrobia bacterium CG1_02_43_26]
MKKLLFLTLTAGILSALGIKAFADAQTDYYYDDINLVDQNFYVAASGSVNFHDKIKTRGQTPNVSYQFQTGAGFHGSAGMHFWQNFRAELEFSYLAQALNKAGGVSASGRLEYINFLINLFYDYEIVNGLDVYFGVGGGYSLARMFRVTGGAGPRVGKGDDSLFAGQVMIGLAQNLNAEWNIWGGYRLLMATRPTFSNVRFTNPFVHMVEIGLRYDI